jgi:type I restriction enzyme R subunit
MFLELDKELFGNDYVKVITHNEPKAQEFIERFCDEEKDRLPQIAISVDMLDTGIDAPSCVNLVFYKPVKSYSKFWQMIGRGSRLRPNLFGKGEDKTHFIIFDLCGNFEFFEENPQGIEASAQESLTEILFKIRLQLAEYLRSNQFKDNDELKAFRKELLDDLHEDIASLDLERFDVKMHLKTVHEYGQDKREVWNHLNKKDIHAIEKVLSPLVKPKPGDSDLARYYDKLLFTLIKKALETPNREEYFSAFINPISKVATTSQKLLKQTRITAVKMQIDLIKLPLDENFWKINGITHLEKLRKGVRELVKYINPEDQRYVTTDFDDVILEDKIKDSGIVSEEGEAKTYSGSNPFKSNIHRLEEIIRKNKDHITISRLHNGETITKQELQQLENMLFVDIDRESLENEMGSEFNLVEFIISLVGLSEDKVNEAFAGFTNAYKLNSKQIQFLETIKQFLTKNGKIYPEKLYDSPFKNYHSSGIDGVFNEKQADKIFDIVRGFNKAN